jgi:hypothetical protein
VRTPPVGSGWFRPIRSKGGWEHRITEATNVSGYYDCYLCEATEVYNFALAKQAPGLEHCAHPYGFSTERNAVVTFQELDAAWREKMALRKPELSERYAEVEEAIVA